MNEQNYELSFGLILHASESKNNSMLAMQKARKGDYKGAKELLEKASDELQTAHQMQTDLLCEEAKGQNLPFSIILVHAQDHLTMAALTYDWAEELIEWSLLLKKEEE